MSNDIGTFVDGRPFLIGSPFTSIFFCVASGLGLVSVGVLVYVVYHGSSVPGLSIILIVLVGLQLVYQWWRALRYYSRVRELYSVKSEIETQDSSPLELALRIATGGLTDLLFYCYGISLTMLVIIGVLLKHIYLIK
jgi:hypothetical protein